MAANGLPSYKDDVKAIHDLPWQDYNPHAIVYLSHVTALEFAHSLRRGLVAHPESDAIKEMAAGELDTDNLQFADYAKTGDHAKFLDHFISRDKKISGLSRISQVLNASASYWRTLNGFSDKERGMTVFSREAELPGLFGKILKAHDWEALGLGFYSYYLSRHIELDSKDGGHHDLVKGIELENAVLDKFWAARLTLYKLLPRVPKELK